MQSPKRACQKNRRFGRGTPYYDFGDHNPTHNNYGVGYEDSIGYRYRNFFVFSLAGIHGTITSATFQAVNNGGEAPRTPTPCTTS